MKKISKLSIFMVAGLFMAGCETLPNPSEKEAVVTTDEILFTLAKGESLYTDKDVMGFISGTVSRDDQKLGRRLEEAAAYPFGSKRNPVRVHMPEGQREYLGRLRCVEDTSQPSFSRLGNFGAGPYETIIDGYQVDCPGKDPVMIYMDMYFPGHIENRAPAGFRIIAAPGSA